MEQGKVSSRRIAPSWKRHYCHRRSCTHRHLFDRYDEILGKLGPFLRQSGYNLKTDVTFIPVSGYTGANIKERVDKKTQSFYDGPSLLEHIDSMAMADRKINAPLMMPISEKYKDMGTVVVGKIESGRVKRGDNVIVMPNKVGTAARSQGLASS